MVNTYQLESWEHLQNTLWEPNGNTQSDRAISTLVTKQIQLEIHVDTKNDRSRKLRDRFRPKSQRMILYDHTNTCDPQN